MLVPFVRNPDIAARVIACRYHKRLKLEMANLKANADGWEIPVVGGEMNNNIHNITKLMLQKPAYYDPAWSIVM